MYSRAARIKLFVLMGTISFVTAGCLSASSHIYSGIASKTELAPTEGTVIQNNTDATFSTLLDLLRTNYSEFKILYSSDADHVIKGKRTGMQHSTDYFSTTIRIRTGSITMDTNYSRDDSISVPKDRDFNATIWKAYSTDLNLTKTHDHLISSFLTICYSVHIQNETYVKREKWMG